MTADDVTGIPAAPPGSPTSDAANAAAVDPERWRLAVVAGVSMELPGAHPTVLLRESVTPYRELRIPVGMPEGNAIAHAWHGIETPRPLTHDLFTEVLTRHEITVIAVRVTARRGQVFYAELDTVGPRGQRIIPCRPSDALALALRQPLPTPVLIEESVLCGEETAPPGEGRPAKP